MNACRPDMSSPRQFVAQAVRRPGMSSPRHVVAKGSKKKMKKEREALHEVFGQMFSTRASKSVFWAVSLNLGKVDSRYPTGPAVF